MSVELLDLIKEQARNLSQQEKAQLADYLLRETETDLGLSAAGSKEETRALHKKWLKENREKYAGRYVALIGDKLVGAAKTRFEAIQEAKNKGVNTGDVFVVYVYPPNYVGETGGWS
jgi:hypothetical protein